MKVAIIGHKSLDPSSGGIENYTYNLVKYNKKIKYVSCTVNNENSPAFDNAEIFNVNFRFLSGFRPLAALWLAFKVRRKANILHLNGLNSSLFLPLICLFGFEKILFTYHSRDYLYPKWGLLAKFVLWLSELSLYICKSVEVIAVSDEYYYHLKGKVGKVVLIKNGVKLKDINVLPNTSKKYILVIGRITKEKRQLELLKAFSENKLKCELHFAGPIGKGSYSRSFLEMVQKVDGAIYLGSIDNSLIPELISGACACVSNSAFEGLPIAAIEYVFYSKRVYLSNILPHRSLGLAEHFYFDSEGDFLSSYSNEKIISDDFRNQFIESYSLDKVISETSLAYIT